MEPARPQTPPPGKVVPPDTEPRSRHTSTVSYRTGDLSRGRTAVLKDLDSIPLVPLTYFNEAVLPPLRQGIDVQKIEETLQESGVIHNGCWAAFVNASGSANEEEYYGRLATIFDAVVQKTSEQIGMESKLSFVSKPSSPPISDRTNTSRPDAYLLLVDKKSIGSTADRSDSWYDVAVTFEFKKSGTERKLEDDDRKAVWSLHHIMRCDPCRRSTYGVTIEGSQMRLWFTCRSVTLVSQEFDFIEGVSHVIHFFSSLAFAEDYELGWDPSIQRVEVKDRPAYKITLNSPTGELKYITTKILADFGADAMRGRGTRVFQAYLEGDPEEESVVIKDSWRDEGRDREDVILDKILADVMRMKENEGATVAEVEAARNCFLTVLHAEDVNIGENTDNTSLLFHGKALPPNCRIYRLPAEEAPSKVVHTPSVGHPPSYSTGSERPPLDPLKITHRIHTRIVFKEVCESLFQVRKLRDVLAMLRDAVKALQILHDAGWIHRDISPGNLLRIGNSVKISDLEYAKRLDSKDSHEVRTGTMDFMACEVEAQRYLFHKAEKRGKSTDIPSALGSEDRPPFRANSLHDLESLWWILAWILYFYVDQDGQEPSSKQQAAYGRMFPGAISGPGRLQALQGGLDVDIFTGAFLEVAAWADEMQTELFQAYRTSERTLPPKYTDAVKETTRYFLDALHNTVNLSGDTSLYDPLPPRKRKKAEGEKSNKRSKHDS